MVTIRKAQPGDARALAEVAEATFRAAFGAQNSVEYVEIHCQSNYGEALQAAEIVSPELLTLVCEENDRLVGFSQLRWAEAPACVVAQHPGEVSLYVVADWHGKGLAQRLMTASIDALQGRGCDVVWLGVWERNPRAITFYQKCSFTVVGSHTFSLGGDLQEDLVMVRAVKSE